MTSGPSMLLRAAVLAVFLAPGAVSGLRLLAEPLPDIAEPAIPDAQRLLGDLNAAAKRGMPALMTPFKETAYDRALEHHEKYPKMNSTMKRLKAQAEPGWVIQRLKSLHAAGGSAAEFWQLWHEASSRLRMVQLGVDADTIPLRDAAPAERDTSQPIRLPTVGNMDFWSPVEWRLRQTSDPGATEPNLDLTASELRELQMRPNPFHSRAQAAGAKAEKDIRGGWTTPGGSPQGGDTCESVPKGGRLKRGLRDAFTDPSKFDALPVDFVNEPGYNCYMDGAGNLCTWVQDVESWCLMSGFGPYSATTQSCTGGGKGYATYWDETPVTKGDCFKSSTNEAENSWAGAAGLNLITERLIPQLTNESSCLAADPLNKWAYHYIEPYMCVTKQNTYDPRGCSGCYNPGATPYAAGYPIGSTYNSRCLTPGPYASEARAQDACAALNASNDPPTTTANGPKCKGVEQRSATVWEAKGDDTKAVCLVGGFGATASHGDRASCEAGGGRWTYPHWSYALDDCSKRGLDGNSGLPYMACVNDPYYWGEYNQAGASVDAFNFIAYEGEAFDGRDAQHPFIECRWGWLATIFHAVQAFKENSWTSASGITFRSVGWMASGTISPKIPNTTAYDLDPPYDMWFEGWDCKGPYDADSIIIGEDTTGLNYATAAGLVIEFTLGHSGENFADAETVGLTCATACQRFFTPGCYLQKESINFCYQHEMAGSSIAAPVVEDAPQPQAGINKTDPASRVAYCNDRIFGKYGAAYDQEIMPIWLCGLCDPPYLYKHITEYLYQRKDTPRFHSNSKFGIPMPYMFRVKKYMIYLFSFSENTNYNLDSTQKGNGTWWIPDAICNGAPTQLFAKEKPLLFTAKNISTRESTIEFYTQKDATGTSLFEKHIAEYMYTRWECMSKCLNEAGSGCQMAMSQTEFGRLNLKWPKEAGLVNPQPSSVWDTNLVRLPLICKPITAGMFDRAYAPGFDLGRENIDLLYNGDWPTDIAILANLDAGDTGSLGGSWGVQKTVVDPMRNTSATTTEMFLPSVRLAPWSQKALLCNAKSSPNCAQTMTVEECQYVVDQEFSQNSEGEIQIDFLKEPKMIQSSIKWICSTCADGIKAINSTKYALEAIAGKNQTATDGVGKNYLYYGVDTTKLKQLWVNFAIQEALTASTVQTATSLSTVVTSDPVNALGNAAGAVAGIEGTIAQNTGEMACQNTNTTTNTIVNQYFTLDAGLTAIGDQKPTNPCGDSGGSLEDEGVLVTAASVAQEAAAENVDAELGGTTSEKEEAAQTEKVMSFTVTKNVLAWFPPPVPQFPSFPPASERRRRSTHRRRRAAHRRRRR